jgi:hypothetical protein
LATNGADDRAATDDTDGTQMRIAIVIRELVLARAKRPDVQTGRAWILVSHPSAFICGCFYLRLFLSAAVLICGCSYLWLFLSAAVSICGCSICAICGPRLRPAATI